jgi:hypothetical protein
MSKYLGFVPSFGLLICEKRGGKVNFAPGARDVRPATTASSITIENRAVLYTLIIMG